MSIADDAGRLMRLTRSVSDLQTRLKDWHQALDSVDKEVAALLSQTGRATLISQAIGLAEQYLRDLDTTLE
ncbi:hypothetical protein [Actinokineospora inagensis]|uniref:hypothetical protein n=1 Tax=Actinokineospora inagensis TaxID=103730 RepID=UPI00047EA39F|nr:hypothetical protein [Actinokineospora inagensis]